jgi:hypothetical protein
VVAAPDAVRPFGPGLPGLRLERPGQRELYDALRERYVTWRRAKLPAGSRVECYEHVDHCFRDGPAPVSPVGLYFGGTVADLAEWVHDVAGESG